MFKKNKLRKNSFSVQLIGGLLIGTFTILALYPFLLLLAGSVTSEIEILRNGFSLIPNEFSFKAYETLLRNPQKIMRAYGVTITITCLGTTLGLILTSMTGYVLACKDFKYAEKFSFYFYFTTLFGGGLIAYYIWLVKYLHIKNTLLVLFVPQCLPVFYILIMRNFIKGIPHELRESAKIDGAGEFYIYTRIFVPLMKSSFACIGLFLALAYWNNWSTAMLYIDNDKMYPLQYLLYQMISNMSFMANATQGANIPMAELPQQSIKLAMTVITIGPIIMAYPFVQKYFVQGMTVGSVKG